MSSPKQDFELQRRLRGSRLKEFIKRETARSLYDCVSSDDEDTALQPRPKKGRRPDAVSARVNLAETINAKQEFADYSSVGGGWDEVGEESSLDKPVTTTAQRHVRSEMTLRSDKELD